MIVVLTLSRFLSETESDTRGVVVAFLATAAPTAADVRRGLSSSRRRGRGPGRGAGGRRALAGVARRGAACASRRATPPGGPALVLRLDEGRVFRLDPEAKVAVELDASRLRARSHEDASVAASLIGGEDALRAAPLAGSGPIAGHRCRGFRLREPRSERRRCGSRRTSRRAGRLRRLPGVVGAAQALPGLVAAFASCPASRSRRARA